MCVVADRLGVPIANEYYQLVHIRECMKLLYARSKEADESDGGIFISDCRLTHVVADSHFMPG